MDNLFISIILLLEFYENTVLACATYFLGMMFLFEEFNWLTLFLLNMIIGYHLYGLLGIFFSFISAIIYLLCGYMYWKNFTIKNSKETLDNFKELFKDSSLPTELKNSLENTKNLIKESSIDKEKISKAIESIGISPIWIERVEYLYRMTSNKYDILLSYCMNIARKFREATIGISGLREIYIFLDTVFNWITFLIGILENFRIINNLKTNNGTMRDSNNSKNSKLEEQKNNDIQRNMDGMQNMMNLLNNMPMPSMESMMEMDKNMSEEEKKATMEMSQQLFKCFLGGGENTPVNILGDLEKHQNKFQKNNFQKTRTRNRKN
jgi:hypothetical protein